MSGYGERFRMAEGKMHHFKGKPETTPHLFLGAAGGGTGSPAQIGLLVLTEDVRLSL